MQLSTNRTSYIFCITSFILRNGKRRGKMSRFRCIIIFFSSAFVDKACASFIFFLLFFFAIHTFCAIFDYIHLRLLFVIIVELIFLSLNVLNSQFKLRFFLSGWWWACNLTHRGWLFFFHGKDFGIRSDEWTWSLESFGTEFVHSKQWFHVSITEADIPCHCSNFNFITENRSLHISDRPSTKLISPFLLFLLLFMH